MKCTYDCFVNALCMLFRCALYPGFSALRLLTYVVPCLVATHFTLRYCSMRPVAFDAPFFSCRRNHGILFLSLFFLFQTTAHRRRLEGRGAARVGRVERGVRRRRGGKANSNSSSRVASR